MNKFAQLAITAFIIVIMATVFAMAYVDGPVRSARYLEEQNKYKEAAEQYVYATTSPLYKKNAGIFYEVAYCARRAGEYDLALDYAKKGLNICKEHPYITSFTQCCSTRSIETRLLTELAWIYYNKEDYENAKTTFDQVLEKEKYYYAFTGRAAVFEAQKMYKEAESDFSKAIETAPSSATREEAYHERARYFRNTGKPSEAIRDLTAGLNQQSCSVAFFDRAVQYKEKGDYKNALEDLDRAIASDSSHEDYYHMRATIHMAQNNFNQAKVDLDAALKLNSDCDTLLADKAAVEAALKKH